SFGDGSFWGMPEDEMRFSIGLFFAHHYQQLRRTAEKLGRSVTKFTAVKLATAARSCTHTPRSGLRKADSGRGEMGTADRPVEALDTAISSLTLHQRTVPTAACHVTYDSSRYLLTSVELPTVTRVSEVSDSASCLAVSMKLDISLVREILSREEFRVH